MERIINLFDRIAQASLILLLFVVSASVLGRIIFDITGKGINIMIPGAIELAGYSLLVLVFASLPRAAISGLVSVDLLVGLLPASLRNILRRLWYLLLTLFAGTVAWLFCQRMLIMISRGDKTQDLEIPLYLIYGVLSVCSICIVITGMWLALSPLHRATANE